ncbi:hypothetical protein SAY86_007066 [Trapa natans]|uniref:Uncharacterized protein n=1 Tax=Trapa natans TaxID=22666 RepID=A0AAN7LMK6_TRANT|nr:hypothetical protein SAY86_007066 [Trapa natans]
MEYIVEDEYADVQKDETIDARRNAQEDNASSENQCSALFKPWCLCLSAVDAS